MSIIDKKIQRGTSVIKTEQFIRVAVTDALKTYEGTEKAAPIVLRVNEILSKKQHPYGKMVKIIQLLRDNGIETDAYYWDAVFRNCKNSLIGL